jgi:hypothetical protein
MLDEEISQADTEVAMNDVNEIFAPGPFGQTFILFKLLFQEFLKSLQSQ